MSGSSMTLEEIARELDVAASTPHEAEQFAERRPMTLAEAYDVQKMLIQRRVDRGAYRIGMKMGFTSRAKMVQMGVHDMIWGRLTHDMRVDEGGELKLSTRVHPRVEPEIAFLLKKPLSGTVSAIEALGAVEAIAPAMEIIDSRYKAFKFSLEDVVADNASSSGIVLGTWHRPDIDFSNLGLIMSRNGKPTQIGTTAAILGHPIRSLVAAARLVAEAGETLPAGSIVMAGGASAAEALVAGDWIELEMQSLGRIGFHVTA
ncbi:2-keto-4-pentenoate hydratase [Pigmentiphaga litoralis]|uniref:2-oxo-3-hexenedioate decarboxylase n=1 Tax=Pigmentiphaga litoralis TaxID=516702 RepID=A0A7Y9LNM6_9BURK|nr:fumarylacetoacetate hydrolase family protein [Pigmentiphaga litoralis]NYE23450.1 2-oxo-3-hexenedioate decarboxylase [Pigmentiphaga litoralis]NYE82936.1 2-oxo-3-hexenedioate decarboxylase [Pigmentiphaga litoralis]GGX11824.1 2-keto-4-pentenoate hydratase [Pigmentiphaga litoralis]